MKVKLKNVGDAVRVVHVVGGGSVSIPIGKEVTLDLHDRLVARLQEAQEKGDTLNVVTATTNRVRVRAEDKAPPPPPAIGTALEALAAAETMEYHEMLANVQRLCPDANLPPRPTRPQMLDVLRKQSVLDNKKAGPETKPKETKAAPKPAAKDRGSKARPKPAAKTSKLPAGPPPEKPVVASAATGSGED